jgi:exopolyphosphatase/pppGpp-phosphohydrolase
LKVGARQLVEDVLRHESPTPGELERAIDLVEDALTDSRLAHANRGELVTADALLRRVPGLGVSGASLQRDAVESLFQRLASRSLGMHISAVELPEGRDFAAALLILRECMHHLGFDRITIVET